MPRILRVINRLNVGGPTYNAVYLTKYLGQDFETLLVSGMISGDEASSSYIPRSLNIEPLYIPWMNREVNPLGDLKSYLALKTIIKRYKPDIVHTHAAKAGALGRLAALNCNVPHIVHTYHGHVFHSYFNSPITQAFLNVERYLAKRTAKIIALSTSQKKELSEVYKIDREDKFEIVPLGFDLEKFQSKMEIKRLQFRDVYKILPDEIAIGIIGRLVPIKNHTLFLKAIKILSERTKFKVKAFIIGDGMERAGLEKIAAQLNLEFDSKNVQMNILTFTSWVREIDKCMAGMDIIALTSLNEGTPVSLIEAQAAGKAIVSTRVGGVADTVIENKTALLSESGNEIDFAENLIRLVENEELRRSLSLQGPAFVEERFGYKRLCQEMTNMYRGLLN